MMIWKYVARLEKIFLLVKAYICFAVVVAAVAVVLVESVVVALSIFSSFEI